jgi:hypothetical protein
LVHPAPSSLLARLPLLRRIRSSMVSCRGASLRYDASAPACPRLRVKVMDETDVDSHSPSGVQVSKRSITAEKDAQGDASWSAEGGRDICGRRPDHE